MEHTLTIHKLIPGGKGLGVLADGMVAMVDGVLPGETVVLRETKTHRGHLEGRLVRVVEPSPDRIIPPCPLYGRCGGCDLQHARYDAQLRIKRDIVQESLSRAGCALPDDQPLPAVASPRQFGYRHRIRLHLDETGNLGFHQATSNQVVPVQRCLLATEPINQVLAALVAGSHADHLKKVFGELELLHSPADDRVLMVLHPRPGVSDKFCAEQCAPLQELAEVSVRAGIKAGRGHEVFSTPLCQEFHTGGDTYQLSWSPACFFQVNTLQNQQLVNLAMTALTAHRFPATYLDLFCGMGNFSLPLGLRGTRVLGIEHNRHSIHWAQMNTDANHQTNLHFLAQDVESALKKCIRNHEQFEAILCDPPRQGLGRAAALLPRLNPRLIVAISCDPATQARDLKTLTTQGYHLVQITPVDMFPQTHHIESLALLERN